MQGVNHEFIVLHILRAFRDDASGIEIYARCERNPTRFADGSMGLVTRTDVMANDTVGFSFDRTKLMLQSDKLVFSVSFEGLKLKHTTDLFSILHDVCPHYRLRLYNCWWYCTATIDVLQDFGGNWMQRPNGSWTKKALKFVGEGELE